jgi:excisionase family DNA binding protein
MTFGDVVRDPACCDGESVKTSNDHAVTLQEAADLVGCHYQTLYKRVRNGEIPAGVEGGSYRIRRSDLDAWVARRATAASAVPSRGRRDWGQLSAQLTEILLAGQTDAARRLVDRLLDGGVGAAEFCDLLFGPTMQEIGTRWHDGAITIADEHRASRTVEALLERVVARSRRPGPRRGAVIVAAPAGDRHSLAPLMVAAGLRADGFEVHYLGCDLPVAEIADLAHREGADLVALSWSIDDPIAIRSAIGTLAEAGIAVIAGGGGLDRSRALDAGAVGYGSSVAEAQRIAREHARTRSAQPS